MTADLKDHRDINKLLLRIMRQSKSADREGKVITSWLDEVRCSGCYRDIEKHDLVFHGSYCRLCVEECDMMEKQGVVKSENEAPVAGAVTKEAADAAKCCGGKACGTDTASKLADAVAAKTVENKH